MHQYFHTAGCQVLYLTYLDFPFFAGLYDGVAYTGHRFPVRNFLNGKCLVVYLFYFGAHAYRTATFTVVVFGYIDTASRLEVGVQLEFFVVQIADGSIAQLIEVMW